MSAADTLRALAGKKGNIDVNRANYHAYVADRVECGGWTTEDVEEYRGEVERIMQRGTEDEQAAAREFWALKAEQNKSPAVGINARIRGYLAEKKRKAA